MKKHNFNAGPSILPREVIENTAQAILDFNGSGLSLMEISHRAKDFQPVVDEAVALFKELLNIPEGYSVLFLGGGASLEFCMVPFNFLEKKAAYLNTGVWAKKAMKEAKAFGEVVEVASSAESTYTYIPKDYTVPADADYFHITTNNTIYGTELKEDLDVNVPMVADMSSDIFSRPIDVSKYICIYGGAQKNLAPAGVTFVIVKNDAVGNHPGAVFQVIGQFLAERDDGCLDVCHGERRAMVYLLCQVVGADSLPVHYTGVIPLLACTYRIG